MAEPMYIFRDGSVYTMEDGKVVASVKEADFDPHAIDGPVEMPNPPADIAPEACPNCGGPTSPGDSFCPNCGNSLDEHEPGVVNPALADAELQGVQQALGNQTITTPNGLKGRVLARTPALWGEQVTVRFENGVIRQIPVDQNLTFAAAEDAPEGTPVERLEERLAAEVSSDKESLQQRAKELITIKNDVASLVSQASDAEAQKLDSISVQADYEAREVQSALDHIEATEGEGFQAPAPIESVPTVEQASIGGNDATWLDNTINEMKAEASATDYEKLMDEGPEAFVASLEDAQLADAGTVRLLASREIRSHTVGADEDIRDKYEKVFLHRCEEQRKARLASRKKEVRKEASADEPINAPDESLFM